MSLTLIHLGPEDKVSASVTEQTHEHCDVPYPVVTIDLAGFKINVWPGACSAELASVLRTLADNLAEISKKNETVTSIRE